MTDSRRFRTSAILCVWISCEELLELSRVSAYGLGRRSIVAYGALAVPATRELGGRETAVAPTDFIVTYPLH